LEFLINSDKNIIEFIPEKSTIYSSIEFNVLFKRKNFFHNRDNLQPEVIVKCLISSLSVSGYQKFFTSILTRGRFMELLFYKGKQDIILRSSIFPFVEVTNKSEYLTEDDIKKNKAVVNLIFFYCLFYLKQGCLNKDLEVLKTCNVLTIKSFFHNLGQEKTNEVANLGEIWNSL